MNMSSGFKSSVLALALPLSVVVGAVVLPACSGADDQDVASVEPSTEGVETLATRPACTAANQGQQVTETVRGVTSTYRCDGGVWELFLRCQNGRCVGY